MSFNYIIPVEELHYAVSAVEFIAEYGWLFLSEYTFNPETSLWSPLRSTDHQINLNPEELLNNNLKELLKLENNGHFGET
eukprot:CAMPEP_0170560268 /NCGR_PEP_ID=MMETSP0211-20121228/47873_1 /TAXON_ID=311385 /ORGANISM="Pseudokeronopsis sp., Strain OXSARD2" /LENGTH=79 /DNA_ID=CAMNT_0010874251 /DNA_START=107 /DNA_END=346 /DNA_ORIENTATION=+